jgi:hypothetical protein
VRSVAPHAEGAAPRADAAAPRADDAAAENQAIRDKIMRGVARFLDDSELLQELNHARWQNGSCGRKK